MYVTQTYNTLIGCVALNIYSQTSSLSGLYPCCISLSWEYTCLTSMLNALLTCCPIKSYSLAPCIPFAIDFYEQLVIFSLWTSLGERFLHKTQHNTRWLEYVPFIVGFTVLNCKFNLCSNSYWTMSIKN